MKNTDKITVFDNKNESSEAFYSRFKEQLDGEYTFPINYMFKFILPTDTKKIAQLHKIFDHNTATFSTKESKNNKYTSVTINTYVPDSTSIIEYYKEVSSIEGVVML